MRALITGSRGFTGRHLVRTLRSTAQEIHGLDTVPAESAGPYTHHPVDLLDPDQVARAVEHIKPTVVYHLAALSGHAGTPEQAVNMRRLNIDGTRILLEALSDRGGPTRMVLVGSSAVYGLQEDDSVPITEQSPLNPANLYGWTKAATEAVAMTYWDVDSIDIVRVRPFNLTGPGEPAHLACSTFARQIAEIELGRRETMTVGDLSAIRDFTDIRDMALGYVAAATRGEPGAVYNLCSGAGVPMSYILDTLVGLSTASIHVTTDRPDAPASQIAQQIGSCGKASAELQWKPQIPIEAALRDLLDDWRARLRD